MPTISRYICFTKSIGGFISESSVPEEGNDLEELIENTKHYLPTGYTQLTPWTLVSLETFSQEIILRNELSALDDEETQARNRLNEILRSIEERRSVLLELPNLATSTPEGAKSVGFDDDTPL